MDPFDLSERVVLLTGAAGYLGRAMSLAILRAGADVVVTGRTEASLFELRTSLPDDVRERCHIIACDITQADAPGRLVSAVEHKLGRLHGLVNNAYAGRVGPLDTVELDDFYNASAYNLVAPFMLVRALLRLLETSARQDARSSSVVNVASMYGTVSPDPGIYGDSGTNNPVYYGATKAGLIQMTRYLACHLGPRGVRVNSVAPGPFPNVGADHGMPGFLDALARKVPLARVGRPEELAGPVVFLLSDAASYVNGINLAVDGGWTAW